MGKVNKSDIFKGLHFRNRMLFSIYIWLFFFFLLQDNICSELGHCCFCLINLKALSRQHKACLAESCNNVLL